MFVSSWKPPIRLGCSKVRCLLSARNRPLVVNSKRRAFLHANCPRFASTLIDLRSDTVTKPSRPMLEAALSARTGDDVMGEDPTVLELEETVADLFRKEKGLYVPTGTMSNLVAIMSHCNRRSSEIIIGANCHICLWEGGNTAGLGGVHTRQLLEDETTAQIHRDHISDAFRSDDDDHFAKTELLCLENSHNMMGGVALPLSYVEDIGHLTTELGIKLHIDGARIFNASVCHNVPVDNLCKPADSVSVCLSKGLGAPLGSVLVGDTDFIRLAKRARKRCGGGMRQAGVVAAMGLYAIHNNISRLEADHRRAKRLANELQKNGFYLARNGAVDTNMFYFGLPDNSKVEWKDYCKILQTKHGVGLTGGYSRGGRLFRAVTHLDISDKDIDRAVEAMVLAARLS
jgi:threonine aldolase